jgi:flagellar protein FlgJ
MAMHALTSNAIDTGSPVYQKLRGQAVQYEGVFLNQLVKEMMSTVKTDASEFNGGFAEDTWRDMQSEKIADAMAQQGGIGLADQLMPVLLRLQEASSTTTAGAPS